MKSLSNYELNALWVEIFLILFEYRSDKVHHLPNNTKSAIYAAI